MPATVPAAPSRPETAHAGAGARAPGADAAAALDLLARRRSHGPKALGEPAPDRQALERAVALALCAPDHGGLRPWRVVRISQAQRPRLGDMFAADAARRGHGADEVERARERALRGPALLALVARIDAGRADVPAHEQLLCAGAALMNLLNALHLLGYGAKTVSGASVQDAEIRRALCGPGETLLAWIVAGTPTRAAREHARPDPAELLRDW